MSTEQTEQDIASAKKMLDVAEHMLNITYPVVKDPKLLLGIVENLHTALLKSLNAYLTKERFFRRVPAFAQNKDAMLVAFAQSRQHTFATNIPQVINQVDELIQAHKDAAMEFTRKEQLVLASQQLNLKKLSQESIKDLIKTVKSACQELHANTDDVL